MMTTESGYRPVREQEEQITLLQLIAVPFRRWRAVAACIAAGLLLAIGFLLVRPSNYTARTVIVPSTDVGSRRTQLMSGDLPMSFLGLMPTGNPHEKLIGAVLKSRTLADSLVSRQGIVPHSGTRGEGEIRAILAKGVQTQRNSDGSFSIQVKDSQAERAAQIANQIPEVANAILSDVVRDAARRKLEFLESQVRNAHDQLEQSERQLVTFQQTEDAPEIQEQARQTMAAAAALQQQIIEQEIKVSQLRRTATADNPALRAAVAELNAWRGQLLRLTSGENRNSQIFLSLRESPELRASATRILREYHKDEQVYLTLTAALAEAQIESQNQLPVVSVLDPAIVPKRPSAVPPTFVLAFGVVLGALTGVVSAFLLEFLRNARRDPASSSFFAAWDGFRSDVRRLVGRAPKRHELRTELTP